MVVNSFLTHGVSAIGLKLPGFSGCSSAELLGMTPTFQAAGTDSEDQQALYRSRRADVRDGQCFRMAYDI